MRCSGISIFATPIFYFHNGGVEGEFRRNRDWELRRVISQVFGFAEGAFSQSDRSTSTHRRQSMQTHRCQSSLSGDGEFDPNCEF